jgi:hypothetical protein
MMAWISRQKVYMEGGDILKAGDMIAVKYVVVVGQASDFAVYMGRSNQTDQEVAEYGDKVPESVGRAVAPYCSHLRYRR